MKRVAKAKKGGVTEWEKKMAVLRKALNAEIKELVAYLSKLCNCKFK